MDVDVERGFDTTLESQVNVDETQPSTLLEPSPEIFQTELPDAVFTNTALLDTKEDSGELIEDEPESATNGVISGATNRFSK